MRRDMLCKIAVMMKPFLGGFVRSVLSVSTNAVTKIDQYFSTIDSMIVHVHTHHFKCLALKVIYVNKSLNQLECYSGPASIFLQKTKLTLYYSLIYPYITYCNSIWSSTYATNLNIIYCLQKRAVRAITNSDYRAHSAPLFSKLGILDIYQINTFQIAKFMYCYHNNLLPPLFFNLFFTNSQFHGYSTRTANQLSRASLPN